MVHQFVFANKTPSAGLARNRPQPGFECHKKRKSRSCLPGRTFERSSNHPGADVRSTSPLCPAFNRFSSLIATSREVLLGKQDLQKEVLLGKQDLQKEVLLGKQGRHNSRNPPGRLCLRLRPRLSSSTGCPVSSSLPA